MLINFILFNSRINLNKFIIKLMINSIYFIYHHLILILSCPHKMNLICQRLNLQNYCNMENYISNLQTENLTKWIITL